MNHLRILLVVALFTLNLAGCSYRGWNKVGDSIVNYSLGPSERVDLDTSLPLDVGLRTQWPQCEVFEHKGKTPFRLAAYFELATRVLPGHVFLPFQPFAVRAAPFTVEILLLGPPHTTTPPLIRHGRFPCKEVKQRFGDFIPII